jgi:hypothetical protein
VNTNRGAGTGLPVESNTPPGNVCDGGADGLDGVATPTHADNASVATNADSISGSANKTRAAPLWHCFAPGCTTRGIALPVSFVEADVAKPTLA